MSVETTSNCVLRPSTDLVNAYAGMSVFSALNLYCSTLTPSTVPVLTGRPNTPFAGKAAFNTLTNCSYQSGFEKSFHTMVCLDKLVLFESIMSSVVEIESNFNSPLAA